MILRLTPLLVASLLIAGCAGIQPATIQRGNDPAPAPTASAPPMPAQPAAATAAAPDAGPAPVAEARPGFLIGYLPSDAIPDSLAVLPPPPAEDSAGAALDQAVSRSTLTLQGTQRWDLAARDAILDFPEAAGVYSCAVGAPITKTDTPYLYQLLRRVLADAGRSTGTAKNHYDRTRPFVANGQPTCSPQDEAYLRHNGSYPSGHTAIGWAWALILAELAPDRADQLMARARAYGQSRVICNVHWQSDVIEGRTMGAETVARLHDDPTFRHDLERARAELAAVRARDLSPQRSCPAEAAALQLVPAGAPWPANH